MASSPLSARPPIAAGGIAGLDRVPDVARQVDAVETGDLLDAGRRGHVDLGQVIADHVDADEDEALVAQRGADRGADVALARRQLGLLGAAADMEVGARLAFGPYPQHR